MALAWLAVDFMLEVVNQSSGIVSSVRPLSFLVGPASAILVGWVLGLRGRREWFRAALIPVTVVLVGGGLLWGVLGRTAGGSEPEFQTVDIGTGGSGCTLDHQARVFAVGDRVRASAEFRPAIPAGRTVTIRLARDGVMVDDYPVVQTADTAWSCVYGDVSDQPLQPGHYRWEIDFSGSEMPPMAAQFEVRE